MFRQITFLKEPVAGLTHVAAGLAAVAGGVALWITGHGDLTKQVSLLIYSASLVAQYTASSAYHLIRASPPWSAMLRKIDHASIFALIAGSYTPVAVNVLSGNWRWGVLLGMWTVAFAGIAFKLATIKTRRWINVGMYVGMGWIGVIPAYQVFQILPPQALVWLVLEALFFTVGAVIYGTKKLDLFPGVFGFHEVWHLFVIAGSLSHFVFVLLYVVPYIRAG
jgi:hemolysin III